MSLFGQVVHPAELGPAERQRMHGLMAAHFEDVSVAAFERDLDDKRWALLLRDETGQLQGFSTFTLMRAQVGDQPVEAVFSGDTIVHRDHWGTSALAGNWLHLALELARQPREHPLYWFLISKGYRTYKFLPLYFRDFWPRPQASAPDHYPALLAQLAGRRFGERYDPASGIVRADGKDRLQADLTVVSEARARDPYVKFFLERNPGHAAGDELACLAELSDANMLPGARRVIARVGARAGLLSI